MYYFGLTFDEKHFKSDPLGAAERFTSMGYESLELSVDYSIMPKKAYDDILSFISRNKLEVCFHIPNFLESRAFSPSKFSLDTAVKLDFEKHFDMISEFVSREFSSSKTLVLHGGEYESNYDASAAQSAQLSTLRFLDWASNTVYNRKLPLSLSIENAYSPHHATYPESTQELYEIIQNLEGAPLGLCLDLTHHISLALKNASGVLIEERMASVRERIPFIDCQIISKISHMHVHGAEYDPYKSHLPISAMNEDIIESIYAPILRSILSSGFSGIISNEILGLSQSDYLSGAKQDLIAFNNMLSSDINK